MFERLRAKLRRFMSGSPHEQAMRRMVTQQEGGSFHGPGADRAQSFESDYHAAAALLRERMNGSYPSAYHERLSSTAKPVYGYGEPRARVIDTASTAIAMALRDGATVEQAAEAGASSVGI
ncbi:hypothetical protein [Methylobacterium amylolyticum]|uniref:hypothetical protein n=1 Tax=Methylobacterium sp. NEAU 140 TaxID=3064945 RepID=UPI003521DC1F